MRLVILCRYIWSNGKHNDPKDMQSNYEYRISSIVCDKSVFPSVATQMFLWKLNECYASYRIYV